MEKIYEYLERKGIDTDTQEYKDNLFLHSLFGINEDGDIYKWDEKRIGFPQPTKEDLDEEEKEEEKEKRNDKKEFKNKIKTLRQQQITILKKKEFDKMKQENLFEEGDVFICQNKLYIITNIKPLQSFPNII